MANSSIYAAFERMWQHIIAKIGTKADLIHSHDEYLTEYTETDPTVPAWAKDPSKPTYTASEVGARPDTWMPTPADLELTTEALTFHYEDGTSRVVEVYVK